MSKIRNDVNYTEAKSKNINVPRMKIVSKIPMKLKFLISKINFKSKLSS